MATEHVLSAALGYSSSKDLDRSGCYRVDVQSGVWWLSMACRALMAKVLLLLSVVVCQPDRLAVTQLRY
jgi:hypothetical protein